MSQQRLAYIDALRGFAILAVVFTHAGQLAGAAGPLRQITNLGAYGVQLFFVVSAFTIFLTYEAARHREANPVRNFFIRRLLRIVPIYWLGIVLYTAVYGLTNSRGWKEGPELWHYPLHLTLTNLLHPLATSSVVPGGWSISCEVIFYMTVPLWFLLVRGVRSSLAFTVAALALGTIVVPILGSVMAPVFIDVPSAAMRQYWFRSFPSQLAIFSYGILLFHLVKTEWVTSLAAKLHINLLLLVMAAAFFLVGFFHPIAFKPHYYFGAGFMLVGLALSQVPWGILVNRATVFVGRISYSAYLIHFLVLHTLWRLGVERIDNVYARFALLFAIGTTITLPLAWTSFVLFERPATRLAKRWIARLEGNGGDAAALPAMQVSTRQ